MFGVGAGEVEVEHAQRQQQQRVRVERQRFVCVIPRCLGLVERKTVFANYLAKFC